MVRTRRNDIDNSGGTMGDNRATATGVGAVGSRNARRPGVLGNHRTPIQPTMNIHSAQDFPPLPSPPGNGIGQQATATAAPPVGKSKRMRWTKEMNINVIKAYFRATKCDADNIGYRTRLHQEWLKLYPQSTVSEQNICDRNRVIFSKKYLSQVEIDQIKSEIQKEIPPESQVVAQNHSPQRSHNLPGDNSLSHSLPDDLFSLTLTTDPLNTIDSDCTLSEDIVLDEELLRVFTSSLTKFIDSDPCSRPPTS